MDNYKLIFWGGRFWVANNG